MEATPSHQNTRGLSAHRPFSFSGIGSASTSQRHASRFVEGSMNDRTSAAPPVAFLGPDAVDDDEDDADDNDKENDTPAVPNFSRHSIQVPRRSFVLSRGRPDKGLFEAAEANQNSHTSSNTAKRGGFFAPLWSGVTRRLHRRTRSTVNVPIIRAAGAGAVPEHTVRERPSASDVMANYQNLMQSGFFSKRAIPAKRAGLQGHADDVPPVPELPSAEAVEEEADEAGLVRRGTKRGHGDVETADADQEGDPEQEPPVETVAVASGDVDTPRTNRKLVKKLRSSPTKEPEREPVREPEAAAAEGKEIMGEADVRVEEPVHEEAQAGQAGQADQAPETDSEQTLDHQAGSRDVLADDAMQVDDDQFDSMEIDEPVLPEVSAAATPENELQGQRLPEPREPQGLSELEEEEEEEEEDGTFTETASIIALPPTPSIQPPQQTAEDASLLSSSPKHTPPRLLAKKPKSSDLAQYRRQRPRVTSGGSGNAPSRQPSARAYYKERAEHERRGRRDRHMHQQQRGVSWEEKAEMVEYAAAVYGGRSTPTPRRAGVRSNSANVTTASVEGPSVEASATSASAPSSVSRRHRRSLTPVIVHQDTVGKGEAAVDAVTASSPPPPVPQLQSSVLEQLQQQQPLPPPLPPKSPKRAQRQSVAGAPTTASALTSVLPAATPTPISPPPISFHYPQRVRVQVQLGTKQRTGSSSGSGAGCSSRNGSVRRRGHRHVASLESNGSSDGELDWVKKRATVQVVRPRETKTEEPAKKEEEESSGNALRERRPTLQDSKYPAVPSPTPKKTKPAQTFLLSSSPTYQPNRLAKRRDLTVADLEDVENQVPVWED